MAFVMVQPRRRYSKNVEVAKPERREVPEATAQTRQQQEQVQQQPAQQQVQQQHVQQAAEARQQQAVQQVQQQQAQQAVQQAVGTGQQQKQAIDAYEYAKNVLNYVLSLADSVKTSDRPGAVCKSCYDLLAFISSAVDRYGIPEKRVELVRLYNSALDKVNEACKGIDEAEKLRRYYEEKYYIFRFSEKTSFYNCMAYLDLVMDWWSSAGYPKDMNALLNYFFKLEGTKVCEEFVNHMKKVASERGFK